MLTPSGNIVPTTALKISAAGNPAYRKNTKNNVVQTTTHTANTKMDVEPLPSVNDSSSWAQIDCRLPVAELVLLSISVVAFVVSLLKFPAAVPVLTQYVVSAIIVAVVPGGAVLILRASVGAIRSLVDIVPTVILSVEL